MTFLETLRNDAFMHLDVADAGPDLQGWTDPGFEATIESLLDDATTAVSVIEVGSWKGKSTVLMADAIKRRGCRGSIVCVDTWLGAPEFWTWGLADPDRGGSLVKRNGYPSVFYTFTRNVKALGHHDIVSPLPLSSVAAASVLAYHAITADLVYIDASHEYESVLADIRAYLPLLRPGGVVFGDDYAPDRWPGVVRAVDEIARETGKFLDIRGHVWILR